MSGEKALQSLLEAALVDGADTTSAIDFPSAKAAVSLAALAVYEAIVSRLCETVSSLHEMIIEGNEEAFADLKANVMASVERVSSSLIPFIGRISIQLQGYVEKMPAGSIAGQAKCVYPRLGSRGLHLVRVVESVVRLNQPQLDIELRQAGVISNVLNLMFVYSVNSILHLSVQRVVIIILEGGSERKSLLTHLLVECNLLKRIMRQLWATRCPDAALEYKGEHLAADNCVDPIFHQSSPCLGHLLNISQAINHMMQDEATEPYDEKADGERSAAAEEAQAEEEIDETQCIKSIMLNANLYHEWTNFKEHILRPIEGQIQSNIEDPEYDANGISAQVELAMQALGLSKDAEGRVGWGGDTNGNSNNTFQFEGGRHGSGRVQELDEDEEEEENEGNGSSDEEELVDAKKGGSDEDVKEFAAFQYSSFSVQGVQVTSAGLKNGQAAPATGEDDFGFAFFDNAPDADLNSAAAGTSAGTGTGTGGAGITSGAEESDFDPFGDSNFDAFANDAPATTNA